MANILVIPRAAAAPPNYIPAEVPVWGRIVSMVMSLVTLCVLSACITRRVQRIHRWSTLPLAAWLIVIIYIDSFLFVFVTAMFKHIGINDNPVVCEGAILLCLICYMSTKIIIYQFLVEKAYIVRGSNQSRLKDWLYLFNCVFMMLPYTIVVVLNFIWRIAYINPTGTCIIGMEKRAMLPLIIFDVAVNVYLTLLFLLPLRRLYSYKHNTSPLLRTMAFRTFLGSCATLTSSIANLAVLMLLKGEPGWICLMCCNADILFSVLVLHWATSGDRTGQTNVDPSNPPASVSLSATSTNKRDMGLHTILSRHYESAAEAEVGRNWPDTIKADIHASCAAVDPLRDGEGIAMNRIMVTRARTMVVEEQGMGGGGGDARDVESGDEGSVMAGEGERREGSMDGIVGRGAV